MTDLGLTWQKKKSILLFAKKLFQIYSRFFRINSKQLLIFQCPDFLKTIIIVVFSPQASRYICE